MAGPLEQFVIRSFIDIPVGGSHISFTNSSLWMVLSLVGVSVFMVLGLRKRELVPGVWQSMAESCYEFIASMVRDNAGDEGRKFFPLIFTLFMFILFSNLLGLIPYSFTTTSHIFVTFVLAFFVFVVVTLVGFIRHGIKFLLFFVPHGAPKVMYPLMIPIEVISYLSRPISLSVRLFANMTAGHTMLKVFAGFVFSLGAASYGVGGLLPIVMNVVLTGFEVLVAFLQAYVFCVLSCLYLNDALHMH